jgi:hypothetical protein
VTTASCRRTRSSFAPHPQATQHSCCLPVYNYHHHWRSSRSVVPPVACQRASRPESPPTCRSVRYITTHAPRKRNDGKTRAPQSRPLPPLADTAQIPTTPSGRADSHPHPPPRAATCLARFQPPRPPPASESPPRDLVPREDGGECRFLQLSLASAAPWRRLYFGVVGCGLRGLAVGGSSAAVLLGLGRESPLGG